MATLMTRTAHSGAAMLLALAVSSLLLPAAASAQRRDRWSDDDGESRIDTTVAFSRNGTVGVTLPNGEIIVRGWDRAEVRIHATSEDGDIRFSLATSQVMNAGSSSRLTLGMANGGSREGHFELTVPYGARLSVHSQSADIDVRGTRGDVEANSQSGDMHVEDVGRLDLGALSGDVQVRDVNGDAGVRTISGDFRLDGVKGDIDVETVSGEIEVRDATSKFVRAHSVSGDVTYVGTIDPAGRYELTTHSGEIQVTMPRAASAQIGVSTWSGSVDSDFPITLKPGEHGFGNAKRFTFDVGRGEARVSLESFSGDITIRRAGGSGNDDR